MKTLVQLIVNATAAGKAMLRAADAAAQRTLLGLGNVDNVSILAAPTEEPAAAGVLWRDPASGGAVKVSVGIPPAITVQPQDATVPEGDTATFSITATGVTSYQWQIQVGGVGAFVDISGATSASYTTGATVDTDSTNKYHVVLTGPGGTTTSIAATLTVQPGNYYQVRGFTDSNYYQGPTSQGLSQLGTVRVVFKLLQLPSSGQKVMLGRVDHITGGGWYIATGHNGAGNAANSMVAVHRVSGSTVYSPPCTFVAGDVGKHFVVHAVISSGKLRLYVGGIEIGAGTNATGVAAASSARLTVGRYQWLTSLSCPDVAIVNIGTTSAAMTPAEILADAATIQERTAGLTIPDLASAVDRFDADSLQSPATDWVATTGGYTMTRTGSLTVEAF